MKIYQNSVAVEDGVVFEWRAVNGNYGSLGPQDPGGIGFWVAEPKARLWWQGQSVLMTEKEIEDRRGRLGHSKLGNSYADIALSQLALMEPEGEGVDIGELLAVDDSGPDLILAGRNGVFELRANWYRGNANPTARVIVDMPVLSY